MGNKSNVKLFQLVTLLAVVLVILYVSIGLYSVSVISRYDNKIYPNTYINNYEISNINKEQVSSYVNDIVKKIESTNITLLANDKKYTYKFDDLGFFVDKDTLINDILTYSNDLKINEKLDRISFGKETVFSYKVECRYDVLKSFLEKLEAIVNKKSVEEKIIVDKNKKVSYKSPEVSFELDINKTFNYIKSNLDNILIIKKIVLLGDSFLPEKTSLSTINTKVSSYTTKFDNRPSRILNLKNAINSINGVILQPNEVFSFYKYAGPYNKKGYVYYDGVIGSGVCQVASTIYNTELLAGLKTIERYPHAYEMNYVDGGLDATVSANKNGNKLDFKFKNTYKYPIYISAYINDSSMTIEFWSNDKAKENKEFKTQSVKIGFKGYKTYLITYKDGKQISKNYLDTTWYPK